MTPATAWIALCDSTWARVDAWRARRDARREEERRYRESVKKWNAKYEPADWMFELRAPQPPTQRNHRYQGRHRAQPGDFGEGT